MDTERDVNVTRRRGEDLQRSFSASLSSSCMHGFMPWRVANAANMLWDSIVRYKTERGALGSKTGYPHLDSFSRLEFLISFCRISIQSTIVPVRKSVWK